MQLHHGRIVPAALLLLAAVGCCAFAQQQHSAKDLDIDPGIARVIAATGAIDNHAHPVLSPPAMQLDREFDALPVDSMEPQTDPLALRPDFAPLQQAWLALFGFRGVAPLSAGQQKLLEASRERMRQRQGEHYADWVLQKAGIETMLANRVRMGTGIQPPRFRWVPYDDALIFPLSNSALAAANPDRAQFFGLEDKLRARYLSALGVHALPPTLGEYLRLVVNPTLASQKQGGAVAIKFEAAYLRGLDFADVSEAQAAAVYSRFSQGGVPADADYKLLQDFLFRTIALKCGELGFAVHLHGMAGSGRYFSIAGANPMLLEPLLNDPRLSGTKFVLLHGGWPFVREAGSLLQKSNFYLDISQQTLMFPPRTLAAWLREWLETYPDKVLFATDAYPYSAALGWEESAWLAARDGKQALGLALTGMLHDGEISEQRAADLAHMVLHDNAAKLYGLPASGNH